MKCGCSCRTACRHVRAAAAQLQLRRVSSNGLTAMQQMSKRSGTASKPVRAAGAHKCNANCCLCCSTDVLQRAGKASEDVRATSERR